MGPLLIVVVVGLTIVVAARTVHSTLTDRHSLEEHHRALDTLGEVAHNQDGPASLAADGPGGRAHVRIVGSAEPLPPSVPSRRRPPAPLPVIPPPRRSPAPEPGRLPEPVARSRPVLEATPPTGTPVVVTPPGARSGPPVRRGAPLVRRGSPPARHGGPPASAQPAPSEPVAGRQPAGPGSEPEAGRQPAGRGSEPEAGPRPSARPDAGIAVPSPSDLAGSYAGLPAPPEPAASLVMRTAAKPDSPPAHRRRRSRMIPAGAVAGGVIVVVGLTVAAIFSRPDVDHATNQRASVVTPVPSRITAAPPPTTPPAPASPAVLVSSNSQGARYNLLSAVNIELVPSSPCWVEIRTGSATGAVVYQGLLRPGVHHPIAAGGPVWLRLGNPPAVAIVINGTPLAPPGQTASQPYDLTFQPATGG